MAAQELELEEEDHETKKLLSSYLGLSFSLFLALFPQKSLLLIPTLESQVRELSTRLVTADEQLRQMKSRRKEDSKANARVVEIFATHRNTWQAEERRLLQQIDAANEEMANLRSKIEEMEREKAESKRRVEELEEMIGFMSRRGGCEFEEEEDQFGGCGSRDFYGGDDGQNGNFGFTSEFLASASKFWAEKASLWQDVQYESLESLYHMKHFVARESPWKVDGESTGVSSKLKLLEEELLNMEKIGKNDLTKVPSTMRKQAKRYQTLAGKIDDLCRRMQASDPCESTVSPEFRSQRQTEFLLEAFRLQQRASETAQKLTALQTEIGKSYYDDDLGSQPKLTTRRSLDCIRNNLKEVQRNLEIWLARIIGDLEGILARDGASRVRECYISRYPFVQ
ncbi:uncharacterized protein LOC116125156 isoform X3 [Pistacia vera]|uniref:uncharacterized protein LOC116125156 isoform X3 n=1 Tax=Pistacia vera TaxID=55513 RepID=UPI001262B88D|nr:uncharacterized protein LOC116125156 isoform X3 [Pistacia vera]